MPVNPLIAMSANPAQSSSFFDELQRARNNADTNALNQEKITQAGQATREGAGKELFNNALIDASGVRNLQAVQNVQKPVQNNPQQDPNFIDRRVLVQDNFNQLPDREKSRLASVLDAGGQLTPLIEADDQQGTIQALQERKKQLGARIAQGEDIHTEDTDMGLKQAREDWNGFKQTHAQILETGQLLGYYKTPDAANVGGGTGILVNRLMKENPNLSFNDALAQVQTGFRQGVNFQGGVATPMAGLPESKAALSKAEESGKKQAQLQYEPTIEGNKAKAKSDSEFKAKAQQNFPQVLDNADYLNTQLDGLLNSPGKAQAVGLSSLVPIIPGTPAADFKARLEQVNGEQFLQAFQSLKGGGQITEIEGKKATDAIARMQTSQTEPEFDKSVKEFKTIVDKATKRARAAAGSDIKETPQPEKIMRAVENIPASGGEVDYREYFK